jgi:hypothetical protein
MACSGWPGECDFIKRAGAEPFGRARHGAAAQRPIEFDGRVVVGQRPHHQAFETALAEVAPCCGEQTPAKAQSLEFGPQIELVNFSVVRQATGAVAPIIRVTGNPVAEHEQRDATAFTNGRFPPSRAAAADQLLELRPRNNAPVGRSPSFVVGLRDRKGVGRLGPANLYEYVTQGLDLSKATGCGSSPLINRQLTM